MREQGSGPVNPTLLKRGLKLIHLRLIATLAETGQISAAAEVLAITQPAASRLIGELETLLGTRLYARHARGVELNAHGQLFAARARAALREMHQAERDIEALVTGGGGAVAIGAVTGPAIDIVVPALTRLRASHPGITASVQVDTSRVLMRGMVAGELDLCLARLPEEMDQRGFDQRLIGPERARILARSGHPLAGRQGLTLRDLAGFDWVLQPPPSPLRRVIEQRFLAEGLPPPERVLNTSSLLLTTVLVAGSEAVAPMAEPVLRFLAGGATGAGVVPLDLAEALEVPAFSLIRPRGLIATPAVRVVTDALLASLSG